MMTTDQDKLAAWFHEYALWNDLAMPEDGARAVDVEDEAAFASEPPPAEGQIRLWPGAETPLYGWLKSAGYARWTLVPFSPLSEPAVPQEFRLRTSGPARVLQGWNRRKVDHRVAGRSWKVDELAETEQFQVEAWLLSVEAGGYPLPSILDRVGPPLRHPLDPRQAYLQAEESRVANCLAEAPAEYGSSREAPRKAAESPERDYGTEPDGEEGP